MLKLKFPKTRGMRRREAHSWLSQIRSGHDPETERKFPVWYSDPKNAAAFEGVKHNFDTSAVLRLSRPGKIESLAAARTSVTERLSIAAAIAAVAAALLALGGHGPFGLGGTDAVMLATNIGEIRQVSLSDGSKVTLDSATKVEIEVGKPIRKARLKAGRARFMVAASDQPFVIEAGKTSISATRGVVDVEIADDTNQVDVVAGSAEVQPKGQYRARNITLQAGEALATGPDRPAEKVAPERDPNWPGGMIQFAATPIRDAVATANRYSDQKIFLEEGVGQLRVSGAFHVGDTARLAKVLTACFRLKFTQAPNGNFILSVNEKSAAK